MTIPHPSGSRARRFRPTARAGMAALAVLAAGVLTSCSSTGSAAGSGGSVSRFGTAADTVDSLNPFDAESFLALQSLRVLYPYLLQYNVAGTQVVGDFATSFTSSHNGTVWTFHTHPGATWSDGKPLTAADAAWTLNTVKKFASGPTAALAHDVQGMTGAKAVDADTLEVDYASPQGAVANSLAQVPILPRHIWGPKAAGTGAQLASYANTRPVTGGSYTLAEYQQNQLIVFKRNPRFYGPKPLLPAYGYQTYTNTDALVDALKNGSLDGAFDLPPTTVKSLTKAASVKVDSVPGTDVELLGINTNPRKSANRSLLDPKVRQAIDLAVDRADLVKVVLLGQGKPAASIIPPALTAWADPALTPPAHDVTKANALLDSRGYRRGRDGIRTAGGHPMAYTLIYHNSADPRLPQLLQRDLRAIGIKLTLKPTDPAAFAADIGKDAFRDFDMSMYDYGPAYDPTTQLSVTTCGQQGSLNFTGYCDQTYDKLFAEQAAAFDPAKRHDLVTRMQQRLADARPVLPLYTVNAVTAQTRTLPVSLGTPLIYAYESKLWLSTPAR
jgi:peptide/nickel transport system substrate-binding protein